MNALEGLVVLDLTRRYPAAYTAMILGDFGAKVIKVDPPSADAPTRWPGVDEERFAAYYALDRNKQSIVLDLKNEAAIDVFRRLAQRADVLLEGFRPGVMDRLGMGFSVLSELNPRLIYCALTGFGSDGPYAKIPAHDMNYVAIGGALSLIGERNGQPYFPSNIVADFAGAGLHGVIGILLALAAREKTGKGQYVDIAYLDSVISLIIGTASEYFETGVVPRRGETMTTGAVPWAQAFCCKDGQYFTIAAAEEHLWANLCRALGREDLIPHHNPPTRDRALQVIAELAAIFETRTRDEWYRYLIDKQACVGPVYTIDETFDDPQVKHRNMVVEIESPNQAPVKQVGIPIKLSDTPGSIRSLGVPTGSDTDAVLADLGYGPTEMANLRARGALG